MHPRITAGYRQRLLKSFGLLFRSDIQIAATITGLSPPPARFGVCLRPTVFVITFTVFWTWVYHSIPGGICQYAIPVSRNNLFAVFFAVFVQVAQSSVHVRCTQVFPWRIRWISFTLLRHCKFSVFWSAKIILHFSHKTPWQIFVSVVYCRHKVERNDSNEVT